MRRQTRREPSSLRQGGREKGARGGGSWLCEAELRSRMRRHRRTRCGSGRVVVRINYQRFPNNTSVTTCFGEWLKVGADTRHGVKERLCEEVDEADLALGLRNPLLWVEDDYRNRQLELGLDLCLHGPLLKESGRPLPSDFMRTCL